MWLNWCTVKVYRSLEKGLKRILMDLRPYLSRLTEQYCCNAALLVQQEVRLATNEMGMLRYDDRTYRPSHEKGLRLFFAAKPRGTIPVQPAAVADALFCRL